ncbi:MAG: hypothetical protein JST38_17895 [Bacteroidetes bacterium]|nr:hypothetical protein [Bacteroidota bacterium]MBS1568933.1 hypothetical protein [Bacteroidota bacterium]MBS1942743.1 hypothetical protein [Bacteroidota bacterium]
MDGSVRNPVLRWLIYGHVWVALAVGAQSWWTSLFLHEGALARRYALAATLGGFAAYGVTRLARMGTKEAHEYANLKWYKANQWTMYVLVGLAGVAAFLLMWPLWPRIWQVLLPMAALTFFYVTPFTFRGRGLGLREVPFLKALLIAVVWSVVAVAVPMLLDPEGQPMAAIIGNTCMRIPLILALAILFDVRDQPTDDPALRTVPLVLGVKGAKAVAFVLLLVSAAFEVLFLRGLGYSTAAWTILAGYAFALVLAVRARPERDAFFYAILVDGVMIAVPICGWLGTLW